VQEVSPGAMHDASAGLKLLVTALIVAVTGTGVQVIIYELMVEAVPSALAPGETGLVKETVSTFAVELESVTERLITGPGAAPLPLVYSSEPQEALLVCSTHLR
jgi:hypothetical protein